MKRTVIMSIVFLMAAGLSAQNPQQELFNTKYTAIISEFNPDGSKQKVTPDNIELFREQYNRLQIGLDEIEQYKYGVLEIGKIFEAKDLKTIDKNGNIADLEKLIKSYSSRMKAFIGQSTEYGIDQNECLMTYSNLKQSLDRQDYKAACDFWREMFTYFPLYQNAYSKGDVLIRTKIKLVHQDAYDAYLKYKEASDAKNMEVANKFALQQKQLLLEKELWIDTLLLLYDQRILFMGTDKNYGKGWSLGKKGSYLMEYRKDSAFVQAYALLKESIETEKEKSTYEVINDFFDASMLMLRAGNISHEELIANYNLSIDLLKSSNERYSALINNEKTKTAPNEGNIKNWENFINNNNTISDRITKFFASSEETKCEFLIPTFKEKFEANKTNKDWLKSVTGILSFKECTDDPFYGQAAEALYKLEPSANAASKLALFYLRKEKYAEAAKFFQEAYTLEEDKPTKAEYYYYAAVVDFAQNKFSNARTLALKAADLKSNYGKPYILIAKIYAASSGQCGSSEFEKKAVYWAAVDKLVKAKSIDPTVESEANDLIGKYSARFPNSEEGFMMSIYQGSPYKIECWIQETTTVRY